jgi:hypothetical protein
MYWPLEIDATNDSLQFSLRRSGQVSNSTYTGSVIHGTYVSQSEFATAIQNAMGNATRSGGSTLSEDGISATTSINARGRLVITLDGAGLSSTNHDVTIWITDGVEARVQLRRIAGYQGFSDSTGPIGTDQFIQFIGDHQIKNYWSPDMPVIDDSLAIHQQMVTVVRTIGGQSAVTSWQTPTTSRSLSFGFLPPSKVFIDEERDGFTVNESVYNLWAVGGALFRYFPDRDNQSAYVDLLLDKESAEKLRPERLSPAVPLYSFSITCHYWIGA